MNSSLYSLILHHAHSMRPAPSCVSLRLDPTGERALTLSYGIVEQVALVVSPRPRAAELAEVAAALSEVLQCSIPSAVIRGLLALDEDTRRYAARNKIQITVDNSGLAFTEWDGLRISRPLGQELWDLHLPEGQAPIGNLWNAIIAARICAHADRERERRPPLSSG